jgi:hypothetical protein
VRIDVGKREREAGRCDAIGGSRDISMPDGAVHCGHGVGWRAVRQGGKRERERRSWVFAEDHEKDQVSSLESYSLPLY